MRNSYVYGVVPGSADARFEAAGVDGVTPYLVTAGEVAAVVGAVGEDLVRASRRNLRAHSDVLAEAVARTTVLPLRFGTVFPSDDAVREELLVARRDELLGLLHAFADRVELTLRAVYDEETVLREVVAQNPAIARLREEVTALPEDAAYFSRIRLGELTARAVEAWRQRHQANVLARLRPLAEDQRVTGELPERVALRASFLVRRERVPEFDTEVAAVASELEPTLRFTYVGPLALHSFVDLRAAEAVPT